jgi:cell division protease FtsH
MDEVQTLIPVSLDGAEASIIDTAPAVTLSIPEAAAEHLAAWTADQRTVAVHEAGHAVVAALLGLEVTSVSIRHHRRGRTETSLDEDHQPRFRTDSVIRAEITVCLAGLAAERRILGEGTDGNADDVARASLLAASRLAAELDPEFPPLSLEIFSYRAMPPSILDLQGQRLVVELERARAEAERLVDEHATAVLSFAARLFAARRLDGEALAAALLEAGVRGRAAALE